MTDIYIRPKDKVENYLEKLIKQYGTCNCTESSGLRSRYYTINTKVLRISDHVGVGNDAYVSIIVPSFRNSEEQYIIHAHKSGQISVVSYEKVKELVRSFFYLSSIFSEVSVNRDNEIKSDVNEENGMKKLMLQLKELEKYKNKAKSKEKLILGIPITEFSEAQLKPIIGVVNKVKKQIENKK